jgi:hypothetical protein
MAESSIGAISAIVAALVSGVIALGAVVLTSFFTKRREHEGEWRKTKLEYYGEFTKALSGVVGRRRNPAADARYAGAVDALLLVAPYEVLLAVYDFQDEISLSAAERTQEKHDRLLTEVFKAIRRDVQPSAPRGEAELTVRLLDVPE